MGWAPISADGCAGQIFSRHNAYQFKLFFRLLPQFKGGVLRNSKFRRFGELRESQGSGVAPIESPPTNSQYMPIQTFGRNYNVMLCPSNSSPIWGLGWTLRSKMVLIEISTQHSYATYIQTIGHRPILHRFATMHNATERERERERSEQAARIGDLKTVQFINSCMNHINRIKRQE